jgi:endothelin-converting enzyme/putative endopeptidase
MKSIFQRVASIILACSIGLTSNAEPSFVTKADDLLGETVLLQATKLERNRVYSSLFTSLRSAASAATSDDLLSAIDNGVLPCDNFYRYACGAWIANNTPPPNGELLVVRGFDMASSDVSDKLRFMMQNAANDPGADEDQQRIGAVFSACMDTDKLEQDGLKDLQTYFALIDGMVDRLSFLNVSGQLTKLGVATVFSPLYIPDPRSTPYQRYLMLLLAGDLGLSDGDVYVLNDKYNRNLRVNLKESISRVLQILGDPDFKTHANQIAAIETRVARSHPVFGRPGPLYIADTGLLNAYEGFVPLARNLAAYLRGMTGNRYTAGFEFIFDLRYFNRMVALSKKYPLNTLKAYLKWRLVSTFEEYLPQAYNIGILTISSTPIAARERWKNCVEQTSDLFGNVVGNAFVANENTAQMYPLVETVRNQVLASFRGRLAQNPWLKSPDSHSAIELKLANLDWNIGAPAMASDLSQVDLSADSYVGKVLAFSRRYAELDLNLIDARFDRNQWEYRINAQDVNAIEWPLKNQIYLLAGLMRAPLLDGTYPPAMNHGAFGSITSHELAHTVGLEGRLFGSQGEYAPILKPADNRRFNARTSCLVSQYAHQRVEPGHKINGKRTLEENLADVSSIRIAYDAFENLQSTETVGNLTPEQLFFVAFAQTHCEAAVPEVTRYLYSRRWYGYSPQPLRVIGPAMNSPEFSNAFQCELKTPMNPRKKCDIW